MAASPKVRPFFHCLVIVTGHSLTAAFDLLSKAQVMAFCDTDRKQ